MRSSLGIYLHMYVNCYASIYSVLWCSLLIVHFNHPPSPLHVLRKRNKQKRTIFHSKPVRSSASSAYYRHLLHDGKTLHKNTYGNVITEWCYPSDSSSRVIVQCVISSFIFRWDRIAGTILDAAELGKTTLAT